MCVCVGGGGASGKLILTLSVRSCYTAPVSFSRSSGHSEEHGESQLLFPLHPAPHSSPKDGACAVAPCSGAVCRAIRCGDRGQEPGAINSTRSQVEGGIIQCTYSTTTLLIA